MIRTWLTLTIGGGAGTIRLWMAIVGISGTDGMDMGGGRHGGIDDEEDAEEVKLVNKPHKPRRHVPLRLSCNFARDSSAAFRAIGRH